MNDEKIKEMIKDYNLELKDLHQRLSSYEKNGFLYHLIDMKIEMIEKFINHFYEEEN